MVLVDLQRCNLRVPVQCREYLTGVQKLTHSIQVKRGTESHSRTQFHGCCARARLHRAPRLYINACSRGT